MSLYFNLLDIMGRLLVFIIFIRTSSDSYSSKTVAICNQSNYSTPIELYDQHPSNPSHLHNLYVGLSACQTSITINWSINIDGSIRSLTGTWIQLGNADNNYRCEYQPPFSEQNNLSGIQQLNFSFTPSNVLVQPDTQYYVIGYNLPPPNPGSVGKYVKHISFKTQACERKAIVTKKMTKKPLCDERDADVSTLLHDDKIILTFMTSSMFGRYIIRLKKKTQIIYTIESKEARKGEMQKEELTITEGCEDLTVLITAEFEGDECNLALHEVSCPVSKSRLTFAVGLVFLFLLIMIGCCLICKKTGWWKSGGRSEDAVGLQLLVVYPAADCAFQHAVTVLAEFLMDCGNVRVVIDMWEREQIAEQGLIRWIHAQADLADIILLILPSHHGHAEDLKVDPSPVLSHHTVSASASALYSLALNLITSTAHDPRQLDKFWAIQLGEMEKWNVPAEVRGCRTFVLPGDLRKLHHKISSRSNVQRPSSRRSVTSLTFHEASRKVKDAVDQLEMRSELHDYDLHTALKSSTIRSDYIISL